MTYDEWAQRYPQAAADLALVLGGEPAGIPGGGAGKSETWSQQQVRFTVAEQGALAWRNNVGATPSKCPDCGAPQRPIRYGLANDSHKLNSKFKSGDLILAIPRIIRPQDVGKRIAQFGSVECKPPGWVYTGKRQEPAQAAWAVLINRIGGFATFSTGDITL